MKAPPLSIGDSIEIGAIRCIVTKIYPAGSLFGVGQVVFSPDKPTTHDFEWDGKSFIFSKRDDFGGYASNRPELVKFISLLRSTK